MRFSRREILSAAALASIAPSQAHAATTVMDSAGRAINLPARPSKVFAAGGPASVALYALRPDAMVGWPRRVRTEEAPYVLPAVRDLPEAGMITGRGDTANIEAVLRTKPDLILDFGSVNSTYMSLADNTQARTGIPYALVDGRFSATAASLRLLGRLLGAEERAEALALYTEALFARLDALLAGIPESARPRVYLARGPAGLETGLRGSINTEIIERAGGRNVADSNDARRGIVNVSPEQILAWDPDVVLTWDREFHQRVTQGRDPLWRSMRAIRANRLYLAPTAPFGWIDRPPSLNRIIGLSWVANLLYGDRFAFDLQNETRAFYKLFYQVDIIDADLQTLVAWADGKPPRGPVRQ